MAVDLNYFIKNLIYFLADSKKSVTFAAAKMSCT